MKSVLVQAGICFVGSVACQVIAVVRLTGWKMVGFIGVIQIVFVIGKYLR